jgi:hypothetical protein
LRAVSWVVGVCAGVAGCGDRGLLGREGGFLSADHGEMLSRCSANDEEGAK